MNEVTKHIRELVRYSNKIEIITPTMTLNKETYTADEEFKEAIERKVEAIEYLKNDETVDITIKEIDEDHTMITLEVAK